MRLLFAVDLGVLTLLLVAFLLLVRPTWASSVRCTTYEVKSLGRLQTLCDCGTRVDPHLQQDPRPVGEHGDPAAGADLHRALVPQDPPVGGVLSLKEGAMSLEALWAVTFGTGQDYGSGVIVFETGRIFGGGDTSFYYIGHYTYNPRDQTISGEFVLSSSLALQPQLRHTYDPHRRGPLHRPMERPQGVG